MERFENIIRIYYKEEKFILNIVKIIFNINYLIQLCLLESIQSKKYEYYIIMTFIVNIYKVERIKNVYTKKLQTTYINNIQELKSLSLLIKSIHLRTF